MELFTLLADPSIGFLGQTYEVYLNLPDPYSTLHDNPLFSIRLANTNMWNENTGYNYLTDITL